MIKALVSYKQLRHCILFNCCDRSLTYTTNTQGDNMSPCLTLFETLKKLDVDWSHFLLTMRSRRAKLGKFMGGCKGVAKI